jgi:hypothetical protein
MELPPVISGLMSRMGGREAVEQVDAAVETVARSTKGTMAPDWTAWSARLRDMRESSAVPPVASTPELKGGGPSETARSGGKTPALWAPAREAQLAQFAHNREDGAAREVLVYAELRRLYPKREGYSLIKQPYLRNRQGQILADEVTHEARRLDFAVVKEGKVVQSVEVTSRTASKRAQLAKEERIREEGGNYIKHPRTGEMIRFPRRIKTEVWRRD